jgi:hypothetical protein
MATLTSTDSQTTNPDEPTGSASAKPDAQPQTISSRSGPKLAVSVLALAIAIIGAWFVLSQDAAEAPTAAAHPPAAAPAAPQAAPAGERKLVDKRAGYQVMYPDAWTEVTDAAGIAGGSDGHIIRITDKNAFSIRTFPLQQAVSSSTRLSDMRAVTDAILSNPDAKLTVLDVRQVKVNGLPAVYYLYYFPNGNQRGVHAHYFVFDGKKMHALVFQVVPDGAFDDYAAQFDRVLASFKPLTH